MTIYTYLYKRFRRLASDQLQESTKKCNNTNERNNGKPSFLQFEKLKMKCNKCPVRENMEE